MANISGATPDKDAEEPAQKLPDWMLGRKTNSSSRETKSKTTPRTSSSTGCLRRAVMYLMSEKELLEMAKEILNKANSERVDSISRVKKGSEAESSAPKKTCRQKQESTMNDKDEAGFYTEAVRSRPLPKEPLQVGHPDASILDEIFS